METDLHRSIDVIEAHLTHRLSCETALAEYVQLLLHKTSALRKENESLLSLLLESRDKAACISSLQEQSHARLLVLQNENESLVNDSAQSHRTLQAARESHAEELSNAHTTSKRSITNIVSSSLRALEESEEISRKHIEFCASVHESFGTWIAQATTYFARPANSGSRSRDGVKQSNSTESLDGVSTNMCHGHPCEHLAALEAAREECHHLQVEIKSLQEREFLRLAKVDSLDNSSQLGETSKTASAVVRDSTQSHTVEATKVTKCVTLTDCTEVSKASTFVTGPDIINSTLPSAPDKKSKHTENRQLNASLLSPKPKHVATAPFPGASLQSRSLSRGQPPAKTAATKAPSRIPPPPPQSAPLNSKSTTSNFKLNPRVNTAQILRREAGAPSMIESLGGKVGCDNLLPRGRVPPPPSKSPASAPLGPPSRPSSPAPQPLKTRTVSRSPAPLRNSLSPQPALRTGTGFKKAL